MTTRHKPKIEAQEESNQIPEPPLIPLTLTIAISRDKGALGYTHNINANNKESIKDIEMLLEVFDFLNKELNKALVENKVTRALAEKDEKEIVVQKEGKE